MDNRKKWAFSLAKLSEYRGAIYGVMAIWIALFHGVILKEAVIPARFGILKDILGMGNIGVDAFLFLSGMGLYQSFTRDRSLGNFYRKRLLRVYLPFLLMAGPIIIWRSLIETQDPLCFLSMITTLSHWTGVYRKLDLWFVSAVLVFYALYPLIYRAIFAKERGQLLRTAALTAAAAVGTWLISRYAPELFSRINISLTRLPVFFFGCWAGRHICEKKSIPWWVLPIAAAVCAGAIPLYAHSMIRDKMLFRYYGSLTGVSLCILLAGFFDLVKKLKLPQFCAFFGGFSLEIYMATIILRRLFHDSPWYRGRIFPKYLVVVLIAVALAWLFSRLSGWMIRGIERKRLPKTTE